MDNLDAYLKKHGIKQAEFAVGLGVSQATVSRLAKNAMSPSLDLAVAIERATDGEVPATSWVPEPELAPAPVGEAPPSEHIGDAA